MPNTTIGNRSSATATATATADGAAYYSAREVYEVTGDASAALQLLLQNATSDGNDAPADSPTSPSQAYNERLLRAMVMASGGNGSGGGGSGGGVVDLRSELPALESSVLRQSWSSGAATATATATASTPPSSATATSRKRRRREEWTLAYNRGLLQLAQGQGNFAMVTVWNVLAPLVVVGVGKEEEEEAKSHQKLLSSSQHLLVIACRMGLLMLEGILALSVGNTLGIPKEWQWKDPNNGNELPVFNLDSFLSWLSARVDQANTNATAASSSSSATSNNNNASSSSAQEEQQAASLKFSLALYTARMGFMERSSTQPSGASAAPPGKLVDAHIRSARKDLKQAMEIFQHKLKPASGDTGSMASSSLSVLSESAAAAANINHSSSNSNSNIHNHQHQHQHQHHHSHTDHSSQTAAAAAAGATASSMTTTTTTTSSSSSLMSSLLQRQNQAGLNLKANTEQLKGNIKKSLILCSEAHASSVSTPTTTTTTTSSTSNSGSTTNNAYDALHYNNLAIVYETHGKPYLALHSWSKAVRAAEQASKEEVERDGTVRLDATCQILWNAAMGSLYARNFWSAYECLGTCLERSSPGSPNVWRQRSRAWLRLGEACIGIWSSSAMTLTMTTNNNNEQSPPESGGDGSEEENGASASNAINGNSARATTGGVGFSVIHVDGEPKGIVLDSSSTSSSRSLISRRPAYHTIGEELLAPVLASPADLEQLRINPLPRARAALEHALELMTKESSEDPLAIISAQVSLAYICLETKDYAKALEYAETVWNKEDLETGTTTTSTTMDAARKALFQRQRATACMYASEAACVLGDAVQSMKFLVGDGKNDAFDRLATALAGVTIETANRAGTSGKIRLAKAQAMVRCSASAASASMGNLAAAKQLAMSAQAMSREGSYATRALVYCMLREGNRGAALTLLRSAR